MGENFHSQLGFNIKFMKMEFFISQSLIDDLNDKRYCTM